MKLLLDTHIAVWLSSNPKDLRPSQRAALENPENALYISAVTAWEIGTKIAKGQLEFKKPLSVLMRKYDIAELPITMAHAQEATSLPLYHRDPFDRMLIAQARIEGMALVTSDAEILRYPVTCI